MDPNKIVSWDFDDVRYDRKRRCPRCLLSQDRACPGPTEKWRERSRRKSQCREDLCCQFCFPCLNVLRPTGAACSNKALNFLCQEIRNRTVGCSCNGALCQHHLPIASPPSPQHRRRRWTTSAISKGRTVRRGTKVDRKLSPRISIKATCFARASPLVRDVGRDDPGWTI